MALSNIFREPRREIIEQAFGTLAVIGAIAVDYACARLLIKLTHNVNEWREIAFWMGVVILGLCMVGFVGSIFTLAIHEIGEMVCAGLKAIGTDPRPKRRY